MTREEIIRLAREAGWPGIYAKPLFSITMQENDFLRFAALVASAEREACAQVCEVNRYEGYVPPEDGAAADYYNDASRECAAAIRARGASNE